ncbi:MAG TPA: response regulator [Chitinophagaceae bacterium]
MSKQKVRRLLIIDDDPEECMIFQEALQQIDNTISFLCINDALKVVGITNDFKPDLIFTDMSLPGISGLECLSILKQSHPDVPVVVYSGSCYKALTDNAYEQGADLVFEKPDTFASLVSGLRMLLNINWADKESIKKKYNGMIIKLSVSNDQKRTG